MDHVELRKSLSPIEPTEGTDPSWFGFALVCRTDIDRNRLVRALEKRKVGTRLVLAGNIAKQPGYSQVAFRIQWAMPQTDTIMHSAFWVGLHPRLDDACCAYVLESLALCLREQAVTTKQRSRHAHTQ